MAIDVIGTLKRIASFTQGASMSSGDRAFEAIADNLINLINDMESPEAENYENLMNMEIYDLNLTVRTINCLKAHDVYIVKELLNLSEYDLRITPNLGRKSLDEIKDALAIHGLQLKGK